MSSVPNKLYHYTSSTGLDGILKDHAVWASSINYLNDADEFGYAFRRMSDILDHFTTKRPELEPWCNVISDYGKRSAGIHVGVFSLSEEPDLLSQWRGYAPSGFSVGFSIHRLTEIAHATGYQLVRCVYDRKDQKRILKEVLFDSVKLYDTMLRDPALKDNAMNDAGYRLLVNTVRLAPVLKNPVFAEEREWRLISGVRRADSGEWRIRVKPGHFVPYLVADLGEKDKTPIRDVVVGPSPQMELALLALPQLFHSYKIAARAGKSELPFRSHQ